MGIAVATFVLTYILLIDGFYRRTAVVAVAAFFLLLTGVLTPAQAFAAVDWSVVGIFIGMLVLADLFLESRMPAVLAARVARRSRSVGGAMLGMCAIASVLSAFLENVAVVLILAPLALALAAQLKTRAAPFLIGIALSSNLQGAATLVGDPPSMLLGSYAGLTFNDFFWYGGRPGMFFAVEVGAVVSFGILWLHFRKYRAPVADVAEDVPRSYTPTVLLVGTVLALMAASLVGGQRPYTSAAIVLVFAVAGLFWHTMVHGVGDGDTLHVRLFHRETLDAHGGAKLLSRLAERFVTLRHRFAGGHRLLRELDWETTLFLVGVFVLVGGLVEVGALTAFADWFGAFADGSPLRVYVALVVFSVLLSAFIDNVPFTIAMLPVASSLAHQIGIAPFLLYAGLLIGASVGGNITPIGAAANIVACRWIEQRAHERVTFLGFVRYGLPFTIAAVSAAAVFGWFAWS